MRVVLRSDSEAGTRAADGVQVTKSKENHARGLECLGGLAGDDEAAVGQQRGGNAGPFEIHARLLHLGRAYPSVPFDRPAIHDRVRDGFEGPRVVDVQPHGAASYSRGGENDSSENTVHASHRMTRGGVRGLACALALLLAAPGAVGAWGPAGHGLVARAAVAASPRLPAWFRDAADQLDALANAPDRWRAFEGAVPALEAKGPDHFFDLDVWGAERLPADRWAFVGRAGRRGVSPSEIGMLPFAILEEYGMLTSAFRDVRDRRPGGREAALAAAGVLAHLLGDAAVPLHVTRHHHGWVGPNPDGFTRAAGVHHWFESTLVRGVSVTDVRVGDEARELVSDPPAVVRAALAESLAQVPRLYHGERQSRVEGDGTAARQLVRERLGAGATLVVRFWRTAWQQSGG